MLAASPGHACQAAFFELNSSEYEPAPQAEIASSFSLAAEQLDSWSPRSSSPLGGLEQQDDFGFSNSNPLEAWDSLSNSSPLGSFRCDDDLDCIGSAWDVELKEALPTPPTSDEEQTQHYRRRSPASSSSSSSSSPIDHSYSYTIAPARRGIWSWITSWFHSEERPASIAVAPTAHRQASLVTYSHSPVNAIDLQLDTSHWWPSPSRDKSEQWDTEEEEEEEEESEEEQEEVFELPQLSLDELQACTQRWVQATQEDPEFQRLRQQVADCAELCAANPNDASRQQAYITATQALLAHPLAEEGIKIGLIAQHRRQQFQHEALVLGEDPDMLFYGLPCEEADQATAEADSLKTHVVVPIRDVLHRSHSPTGRAIASSAIKGTWDNITDTVVAVVTLPKTLLWDLPQGVYKAGKHTHQVGIAQSLKDAGHLSKAALTALWEAVKVPEEVEIAAQNLLNAQSYQLQKAHQAGYFFSEMLQLAITIAASEVSSTSKATTRVQQAVHREHLGTEVAQLEKQYAKLATLAAEESSLSKAARKRLRRKGFSKNLSRASGKQYKFYDKQGLARYLNIHPEQVHPMKRKILEKCKGFLKKSPIKNPDIGIDELGNIVLKHPITKKTTVTNVPLKGFKK